MTKGELVQNVYITLDRDLKSKAAAERAVNAVLDSITSGIVADGSVRLQGFGTFKSVERAARTAHNPRTGETVDVPAKLTVKFKPSHTLVEKIG